ncbi:MAG: nickel-dependent lactate racemase [Thermodesulfobacteriota bacterium]
MGGTIEVPWGDGSLALDLPPAWRVLGVLESAAAPQAVDPAGACAEALKNPLGAAPLGGRDLVGKRVVLVVDDHTRPTPVAEFIAPVLEELSRAGTREEDLEILVATGVHRASRPEEVSRKVGPEAFGRLRWRCHSAYDPEGLAEVGLTKRGTRVFLNKLLLKADLIVGLGAVEPHLLLGFGGGLKILIPGCAGAETIGRNHLQGVDPEHFDCVGARAKNSPMRLDLEEGAALVGREVFVVNAAMNAAGRPVRFFAGDPVQSHRAAEDFVAGLAGIKVPEQADVVLTNSHPMDTDLRQSVKCLGNTLYAARPGGIMLGLVRCLEGLGEMPIPKKTLPYPVMRSLLRIIGRDRVLPLVQRVRRGEPVEEVFISHFGLQMLRRNHLGLFSDSAKLPPDVGRKMGLARSFTRVADLLDWAAAKAPRQATVWVFPRGGASFAVFEGKAAGNGRGR